MTSSAPKTAIVTGISGQGGAYLAAFLLARGYRVLGAQRRSSSTNLWRLAALGIAGHPQLELVDFDLTDLGSCVRLVRRARATELYNLAAASFVGTSFDQPISSSMATGIGALHLLEAIRIADPALRFFQASSSEMFGRVEHAPQDESTPFHPRNPYGIAKQYAHHSAILYREAYGLFACNGILYNHESPLRSKEFVTRKITHGVARIKLGLQQELQLGNIDAKRDWGHAKEYVDAMWRMMQLGQADDFVVATGRAVTVREFVTMAFAAAGIALAWHGAAQDETGIDTASGKVLVRINPAFYRPAQQEMLVGNPAKAERVLGWKACTTMAQLCADMVEADLQALTTQGSSR